MNNFRSEPFLWIHLAGAAAVPLLLQIVWLGLAVGDPLSPFWLELLLLGAVGILPVFWMQWNRPFDIFSLLFVSVKPQALTSQQQSILSLFKSNRERLLAVIAAVAMTAVLWLLYQYAPLAASAAAFLPQWRVFGLFIAAIAFLACNLFVQVPLSVLGVLLTKEAQLATVNPYPAEQIPQGFIVPGLRVNKILSL